jgi:transcriptional regulator with XRE-family HTH domain
MGAIVVLKFPVRPDQSPAIGSSVRSGVVVSMAKESLKRKPAEKKPTRKRVKYIPASEPLAQKWRELEDERRLSQNELASLAGASEGAISQFLRGKTSLTIEWALQFALYMRVSVIDIWPDFPFAKLVPGGLSPDEIEVALRYRVLRDANARNAVKNLLRDLQGGSSS